MARHTDETIVLNSLRQLVKYALKIGIDQKKLESIVKRRGR